MRVWSLGRENPLEEGLATHSSILAWRIQGQRSLVGYSPWGHKESDMTEARMQESWQLEQRQGNTSLNQMTPGWHVRGHGWKAKGHLRKSRGKREGERPPLALLAGKKHVFRRAVPLTSYGWWQVHIAIPASVGAWETKVPVCFKIYRGW